MSLSMSEAVTRLRQLSPDMLHARNRELSARLFKMEWHLAAHLMATALSGLHRELGFGSVVAYAEATLNLHPQKASELFRAARTFEKLPAISEAFRLGRLGWKKVQAITRVATPETEAEWLEKALKNNAGKVSRMVVVSPRALRESQAEQEAKAARESQPELCFSPCDARAAEEAEPEPVASRQTAAESPTRTVPCEAPVAEAAASLPVAAPPDPPTPEVKGTQPSAADPLPQWVNFGCQLTAEEYAVLEQALKLMASRNSRCRARAKALVEMARQVLSSVDRRTSVKYQVLIHVDAESGEGFFETDKGFLLADVESVGKAMVDGPVLVTGAEDSEAEQLDLLSDDDFARGKRTRTPVPIPTVRALFVRPGGCCERCGCRSGPFNIHHRRPWSRGGRHRLQELELLCVECHRGTHQKDFDKDPLFGRPLARLGWRSARRPILAVPRRLWFPSEDARALPDLRGIVQDLGWKLVLVEGRGVAASTPRTVNSSPRQGELSRAGASDSQRAGVFTPSMGPSSGLSLRLRLQGRNGPSCVEPRIGRGTCPP